MFALQHFYLNNKDRKDDKFVKKKTIIVGLSGASGVPVGIALLKALKTQADYHVHLIITNGALATIKAETPISLNDLLTLADGYSSIYDLAAPIASGTYPTAGMIVCPCSMKTLAGIAYGYSENLLLRAADVTLKERRKLVLVTRETPLSSIHLNNMLVLSNMGAVILPAMMTYYINPPTAENMTNHLVGKILDQFDLELPDFKRWGV